MNDSARFADAGDWLLRLQDDDLDAEQFASWLRWYEADARNRAAFEEAQAAFEAANGLRPAERDTWARSLVDESHAPRFMSRPPARARWLRTGAIAACFAALAAGVVAWQPWDDEPSQPLTTTLRTPRATHRLETLPDGSTVELGARSSISLSYSRETRYLVLESGEAFFTVARDAARPFVVQAGPVAVHAVGTEFNVRRDGDTTIVTVREGRVEIVKGSVAAKPVRLAAGEQAAARDPEPGVAVRSVSPQAIAAWQHGRLEFADEPLRQVVATVNRYSAREVVVTDQTLAGLRITGTVGEDRIDEWMRALPAIFPIRVVEVSRDTVLLSPAAPP